MIIKSIEINNFLTYYASNTFKFDAGSTIIIGQNNTGKSKLFDAYNWVLYNQVYQSELEDWKDTNFMGENLVNKLAKNMCAISAWLSTSVTLSFEDDNANTYLVTREYRIQRLTSETWSRSTDSELNLTKREAISQNTTFLSGEDANVELNKFFPKNLSRYFLFQGEAISQLLRLNKRSDFTRAINEMSGIKYFAKASRYANKVYEKFKYEFDNKEEQSVQVLKGKLEIANKINGISEKLNDLTKQLENEYIERDIKQIKFDEKTAELSRYEECGKLLQEIKLLEKELLQAQERRKDLYEYNRVELFNSWFYTPVKDQFASFLSLYRKGKEESKIPEPIRQDFIRQMLQENVCKVCGTIALEGSDAYNHIAQHINDRSLDHEVATINTLSDTADTMITMLNQVPEMVTDFKLKLRSIQELLNSISERIDYREDELRIVIERLADKKGEVTLERSEIEKVNIIQLKRDIDQIREDLVESKDRIAQLIGRIEETQDALAEVKKEEEKLVANSSNELERNRMQLAKRIKEHASKLHQDFLGRLLKDIEQAANECFSNMTATNTALSGSVRIDYLKEEVYIVDEHGRRMTNINQANRVSLQISFVAAVLSVSNKIWDNHFPFVADAPISALGGNNKLSAIITMINIFRQSILILKDDAAFTNPESIKNDEVRQLIQKNSKIHYAYELRMSDSTTSDEQHTEIKILKK